MVSLLDTSVSPAKTDEPIKMPFGLWTWMESYVEALTLQQKWQFWGISCPFVKYRKRIWSAVDTWADG